MLRWAHSEVLMPAMRTPDIPGAADKALARGAVMLFQKIKELIAPHSRTRNLLNSWHIDKTTGGYTVFSDDPASIYLDEGTGSHDIAHKNKKILRFELDAEFDPTSGEFFGDEIYTKRVKHPGTQGIHYIEQAEAEILPQIEDMLGAFVYQEVTDSLPSITTRSTPFEGAVLSSKGQFYYGRRGAGGRFISRSG